MRLRLWCGAQAGRVNAVIRANTREQDNYQKMEQELETGIETVRTEMEALKTVLEDEKVTRNHKEEYEVRACVCESAHPPCGSSWHPRAHTRPGSALSTPAEGRAALCGTAFSTGGVLAVVEVGQPVVVTLNSAAHKQGFGSQPNNRLLTAG